MVAPFNRDIFGCFGWKRWLAPVGLFLFGIMYCGLDHIYGRPYILLIIGNVRYYSNYLHGYISDEPQLTSSSHDEQMVNRI
jgi:hypothetical protein